MRSALAVSLWVLTTVSIPAFAQSAGDSLRLAGDLRGAIAAFTADVERDVEGASYALASTYALTAQAPDSAFRYLEIALVDDTTMKPLWDADFYALATDPRWIGVEDTQLDKLSGQVSGAFDREYARSLLRLRAREWGFRYHVMLAFRQLGPDSPIVTALGAVMQEHHRTNEAALDALIEAKGWPEVSAVGLEAAYAAGNVINHADLATRQRYLPLLEAVCARGEGDWSRYAHIYDRTELELGRPQLYGTQMEETATGMYVPRPLVDPDAVDARRADKGIELIQAQLDRFNESMARDFGD